MVVGGGASVVAVVVVIGVVSNRVAMVLGLDDRLPSSSSSLSLNIASSGSITESISLASLSE